jgi:hypothetical protein
VPCDFRSRARHRSDHGHRCLSVLTVFPTAHIPSLVHLWRILFHFLHLALALAITSLSSRLYSLLPSPLLLIVLHRLEPPSQPPTSSTNHSLVPCCHPQGSCWPLCSEELHHHPYPLQLLPGASPPPVVHKPSPVLPTPPIASPGYPAARQPVLRSPRPRHRSRAIVPHRPSYAVMERIFR